MAESINLIFTFPLSDQEILVRALRDNLEIDATIQKRLVPTGGLAPL